MGEDGCMKTEFQVLNVTRGDILAFFGRLFSSKTANKLYHEEYADLDAKSRFFKISREWNTDPYTWPKQ